MTTNRNDLLSLKFIDEQCALPLLQQEGLSFAKYELVREQNDNNLIALSI